MEGTTGTGDRPTFAQAFASEGTAVDSPPITSTTETAETAASATETPAPGESTPAQGPIPYDRHKSILDGAYKERDSLKQQLDGLAWAKALDRQAIEQAHELGTLYNQDRAGYIRAILDDALNDQALAPVLRSEFGRRLAQRTQADAAIEPDIPVYDGNGQLVAQTFSADRVQQIVQRAIAEAIGKEVAPIKQTFAQQEQARKVAAEQQKAMQKVDAVVARLEQRPLFKENEVAIAEAMDLPQFAGLDPIEQAYAAYHYVVEPKLQASHEAKALDSLKTKAAAASGSVNPATAAVSSTTRPTSFNDPRLTW